MTTPDPFAPGYRLTDGNQLNDRVANPQWSSTPTLTATAGGTVVTSAKIVETITQITAASAPNSGVVIEQALPGRVLWIVNNSLNTIVVFAEGGSTIDGIPGNVGIILDVSTEAYFIAIDTNKWQSYLGFPAGLATGFVNIVTNIVALRAWNKTAANSPEIVALVYNNVAGDGGGLFYLDAADHVTPDNGTTVIVDAVGNRWKRELVQATYIANTPAGNIVATTAQGAINELDVEKVSYVALAATNGSSLVGYTQGGAGAVAETVQAKLRQIVSVDDFGGNGNGVADNAAAFTAAIAAADAVYVPPGNYAIATPISLTAGKRLYGPGNIKPAAGYVASYLMLMATDSTLEINGIDGTGMPLPVGAWTGGGVGLARAPVGCAIFINGSAGVGNSVDRTTIRNVKFTNFPSGPICTFYANFLLIEGCRATTTQTAVVGESNAVYSINYSTNVRLVNNSATTYNYKVFYFGNCTFGLMEGCICQTGSSAVGFDASHYISGGSNHQITSCSSSYSFGVKLTQTFNVVVNGYNSLQSASGGIIIQSSSDIVVANCMIKQPVQYGIAVIAVETETDSKRIRITNCEVDYSTPGAGVNNIGCLMQLSGGTTHIIDDVEISNCVFRTPFYGVKMDQLANAQMARIKITNCSFLQPAQYAILAYSLGLEISGCLVYGKDPIASPLISCHTQPGTSGSYLRIINNRTFASDALGATQHYNLGNIDGGVGNSLYSTIEFVGNSAEAGNYFMRYSGAVAGSTLNTITVQNNLGYLVAAPFAIDMTMGATNTTYVLGNSLVTGAGRVGVQITNAALVTTKVDGGATGNNINTGQPVYVP